MSNCDFWWASEAVEFSTGHKKNAELEPQHKQQPLRIRVLSIRANLLEKLKGDATANLEGHDGSFLKRLKKKEINKSQKNAKHISCLRPLGMTIIISH